MGDGSVDVLGSINMDVVFKCRSLPRVGETLICDDAKTFPGGKGLNQAIAAARAGASTRFYGAVGSDPYGAELIGFLAREGVSVDGISTETGTPTGLAHILVDAAGQNVIAVASGANKTVSVSNRGERIQPSKVAISQLEVPRPAVELFLQSRRSQGSLTILNAAPAHREALGLFDLCDYVILNEVELGQFASLPSLPDSQAELLELATTLAEKWRTSLVLTLGAKGVILADRVEKRFLAAERVTARDTTGAGDCFCGYFAASLSRGRSPAVAVHSAIKASAISVTRDGAASSIPYLREVVASIRA